MGRTRSGAGSIQAGPTTLKMLMCKVRGCLIMKSCVGFAGQPPPGPNESGLNRSRPYPSDRTG